MLVFLEYSNTSKACRVYNKRTVVVEESMYITFDEFNHSSTEKVDVDDDAGDEIQNKNSVNKKKDDSEDNDHEVYKKIKLNRVKMKVFLRHSLKSRGMSVLTIKT